MSGRHPPAPGNKGHTMNAFTEDDAEIVREIIGRKGLKRDERVAEILAALTPDLSGIEVSTRTIVEDVEAYGLVISLDAAGNAAFVEFPTL